MTVKITFGETLIRIKEQGIEGFTKNAIAVEAKIRPSTMTDLDRGDSKAIKFETLNDILNAMNRLYPDGDFKITDIIDYVNDQE